MDGIKCFLGVFLSVLFSGYCYSEPISGKRILLNFDEAIEQAKELKMSDFFSSVDYVSLETTEHSQLSSYTKIGYITQDYILCITENMTLNGSSSPAYLFDRQGRFLRTIGSFGMGLQKLSNGISSGYISKNRDRIVLFFDKSSCGVTWYDFSGQWVGERKMSRTEFLTYACGKGSTQYYSEYFPHFELTGTDERIIMLDRNVDSTRVFTGLLDSLGNLDRISDMFGTYISSDDQFIPNVKGGSDSQRLFKGAAYFPCFTQYSDYIGMYDYEDSRYCRFYYDGRVEYPYGVYCTGQNEDSGRLRPNYKQKISGWLETDRFCFIDLLAGGSYKLIYDKQKDKLYALPEGVQGLKNDMMRCDDWYWWPVGVTEDGVLYTKSPVSWIKEQSATSSDSKIKTLVESLKEDDNDVLVFVHPKK